MRIYFSYCVEEGNISPPNLVAFPDAAHLWNKA